jgi:hypothetical protein
MIGECIDVGRPMQESEYLPRAAEPVSLAVVRAVADANDVDPMDLDERLHDCIDPDALDRLFDSVSGKPSWDGRISFTMAGCRVEVEGRGTVLVTPLAEESSAPNAVAP